MRERSTETEDGTMSSPELRIEERAAMLALMAAAREIANPELREASGFVLVGAPRRRLNELRYVVSRKEGNAYVHELTDQGWAWCTAELSRERPARVGSAGGALYAVLVGLRRYLQRVDLRLADVFRDDGPTIPEDNLEIRIRAAYHTLAARPGSLVSLTDLRQLLGEAAKVDVDAALTRMNRISEVTIVPEANRKSLSKEDRDAAVRIGGEAKHLLSIGAP